MQYLAGSSGGKRCRARPAGRPGCGSGQRGVALFLSVLFLFLLTLLGIASMKDSMMQERMTSNYRDNSMAFQAAEAGLRVAETWIANRANPPTGNLPNNMPYQGGNNAPQGWAAARAAAGLPNQLAANPEVTIQQRNFVPDSTSKTVGQRPPSGGRQYYSIEVVATGGTNASQVVLETTFARR